MTYEFLKSSTVTRDMADILLGEKLGGGMSREVFACAIDPTIVIKIETRGGSFQNVMEHRMWEEVQYYKPMAKWLSPVISISPCGTVLLQRRADPIRSADLPKDVPAFLTDVKKENWGIFNGKPVCFDYGTPNLTFGKKLKMKKAVW